jgi:hypothetical protein
MCSSCKKSCLLIALVTTLVACQGTGVYIKAGFSTGGLLGEIVDVEGNIELGMDRPMPRRCL